MLILNMKEQIYFSVCYTKLTYDTDKDINYKGNFQRLTLLATAILLLYKFKFHFLFVCNNTTWKVYSEI
jgi:hypothetical protein